MKLNILVLHDIPDLSRTFLSCSDYVLCYERYAPEHNYIYFKISDPVAPILMDIKFDVVIFSSTALAYRRIRPLSNWPEALEKLSFLNKSHVIKIAYPQDDYHQTKDLDQLFDDWKFDVVYTVMPNHHALLYPLSINHAYFETVLTGYVDDKQVTDFSKYALPLEKRSITLGQRVTRYSALGGRFAMLKGMISEKLAILVRESGLKVDVSTDTNDRISGVKWLKFLGNCQFVPGCEGGVSILDRDGSIYEKIVSFTLKNPQAGFEEIEDACFPGLDGKYLFSAVSPRLFETAMMRCCQVLVRGSYLGVLEPYKHYIPVNEDLSDLDEAVCAMRDLNAAKKMANATYETLISNNKFRYRYHVQELFKRIKIQLEFKGDVISTAIEKGEIRQGNSVLFRQQRLLFFWQQRLLLIQYRLRLLNFRILAYSPKRYSFWGIVFGMFPKKVRRSVPDKYQKIIRNFLRLN